MSAMVRCERWRGAVPGFTPYFSPRVQLIFVCLRWQGVRGQQKSGVRQKLGAGQKVVWQKRAAQLRWDALQYVAASLGCPNWENSEVSCVGRGGSFLAFLSFSIWLAFENHTQLLGWFHWARLSQWNSGDLLRFEGELVVSPVCTCRINLLLLTLISFRVKSSLKVISLDSFSRLLMKP